jgi:hypothetical protein
MSDTPETHAAILIEPYQVREIGFEVVKAEDMAAMERSRDTNHMAGAKLVGEIKELRQQADALADILELVEDELPIEISDDVARTLELYRSKYRK